MDVIICMLARLYYNTLSQERVVSVDNFSRSVLVENLVLVYVA